MDKMARGCLALVGQVGQTFESFLGDFIGFHLNASSVKCFLGPKNQIHSIPVHETLKIK